MAGEVVFNTGMAGYVETLTDPSYRGQILVLTYPLQGNYGVPPARPDGSIAGPFESGRIQVQGLVVQHHEPHYSHHAGVRSLGAWLKAEGVAGIEGVDTRALTRRLREAGTMRGVLFPAGLAPSDAFESASAVEMHRQVFEQVVPGTPVRYGPADGPEVLLVDVGAKDNIVRSLVSRGARVHRVSGLLPFTEAARSAAGIVLGNGPGDPGDLQGLARELRSVMEWFQGPDLRCLPRQSIARHGGGSPDLQAALRASQREPAGSGPRERPLLHYEPEPRLRGGRSEPARRLGAVVRESQRRHQRGDPVARAALPEHPIPSGSSPRPRGHGLPLFDDFLEACARR